MVNILPKYAVGLLAALGQGGSWQQLLWGSDIFGDLVLQPRYRTLPDPIFLFTGQIFGPLPRCLSVPVSAHQDPGHWEKRWWWLLWLLQAEHRRYRAMGSLCLLYVRVYLGKKVGAHRMIQWLVPVLSRSWPADILAMLPFVNLLCSRRNNLNKVKNHGPKISRRAVKRPRRGTR